MSRFRRWLPDPESIRHKPWLRWLGPALHHPHLWQLSRRGLALGMALGMFFGLLIPLAQIPASAAAAVLLRANVPAAVASTLVTNPVTFAPVYYAAWRLGSAVLGESDARPPEPRSQAVEVPADASWWSATWQHLLGVGKPLIVGLAILATTTGLATYFIVSAVWRASVLLKRRRRRRGANA